VVVQDRAGKLGEGVVHQGSTCVAALDEAGELGEGIVDQNTPGNVDLRAVAKVRLGRGRADTGRWSGGRDVREGVGAGGIWGQSFVESQVGSRKT